MTHLTEDQITRLAELEHNSDIYTEEDYTALSHLKECQECYDSYILTLALFEVIDGIGTDIVAEHYGWTKEDRTAQFKDIIDNVAKSDLTSIR